MENIKKNLKQSLYALLIAGMIGSVSACNNKDSKSDIDTSSSTNMNEAYQDGSDAETTDMDESSWMRERDAYVSTHRATLDRIDGDLESWKNKMDTKSAKANSAMKESMKSLEMKKDQLEDKLNEMEQSTEENWTRMRDEVDEKAMELERTHEAFTKEYGKK